MKASFVLGLIGGIFGIFGGLFALIFSGIGSMFGADGAKTISVLGCVAIVASTVAIVASVQTEKHPKRSGWLLIGSGIVGLISISFFYILPLILIEIAGVFALTSHKSAKQKIE